MRKSRTTVTRHQEDKQSRATSSLFPIEMIAKLEWTQSNAQQNINIKITDSHIGTNNQHRINNNRTTALERTAYKATGVQMHFTSTKSSLRSKLPSQHSMLDHHRHASETPFKLRFANGLILAYLFWHLDSLIN